MQLTAFTGIKAISHCKRPVSLAGNNLYRLSGTTPAGGAGLPDTSEIRQRLSAPFEYLRIFGHILLCPISI
jgi:hypothetical protein